MPLSQDDSALDYDGSWGDASNDWPRVKFATESDAKVAHQAAWRDVKIPYGCYVLVDDELRLETVAQARAVYEHMTKIGVDAELVTDQRKEATMKTLNPVTITIKGEHDSGKTTLARLLEQFLDEHGYRHVAVTDLPPLSHDQKDRFSERFERNRNLRPVVIRVELEGAEAEGPPRSAVSP